jgi:hypothetical protein
MKFSFWLKDGVGNRFAVSTDLTNAVWAGGYVIRIAEGQWMFESDPTRTIYPTADDAAKAMLKALRKPPLRT